MEPNDCFPTVWWFNIKLITCWMLFTDIVFRQRRIDIILLTDPCDNDRYPVWVSRWYTTTFYTLKYGWKLQSIGPDAENVFGVWQLVITYRLGRWKNWTPGNVLGITKEYEIKYSGWIDGRGRYHRYIRVYNSKVLSTSTIVG